MSQKSSNYPLSGIDPKVASGLFDQKMVVLSRRLITLCLSYLYIASYSKKLPRIRGLLVADPGTIGFPTNKPFRRDIDPRIKFYLLDAYVYYCMNILITSFSLSAMSDCPKVDSFQNQNGTRDLIRSLNRFLA